MLKRLFVFLGFVALPLFSAASALAQESAPPPINVTVDLVQLNVAVTDHKGNYITGLRPEDFVVTEDKIPEKIATFGEGDESVRVLLGAGLASAKPSDSPGQSKESDARVSGSELTSLVGGANVFVLFDTSNYMYRGFVFAQDAIADFVRSLEKADRIALYSYSRDLSRAALLTSDRARGLAWRAHDGGGRRCRALQLPLVDREGRGPPYRKKGDRRFLKRPRQRQHGAARRSCRVGAIHWNDDLHGKHRTGTPGTDLQCGISAHDRCHRRKSLFC